MEVEVGGPAPALAVTDLTVRYGEIEALAPTTIAVRPAEAVAVVGPSGAGKSTLLLAVAGLVAPSAGQIIVGGLDLEGASERDRDRLRREVIGFVHQAGRLVPELTVAENVALPLRLTGTGAHEAERRALEVLEELDLATLARRDVADLSGGQVQRAAIARALVHRPQVVLADEPTGALDADNAGRVIDLLVDRSRARDAAVLLVTHDPNHAARADRIVTLRPAGPA